jgi:ribonuclease P protein component
MRKGRKCATHHFVVFVSEAESKRSRLGITVSRKVGNAVRRTRVKRWFREVFRNQAPCFSKQVDMVILARRRANFEVLSFAETRSELEQAFQQLELCP